QHFTLADYITQQARIHELVTEREIGDFVGVSSSTIHKHLTQPELRTSIGFLEKLSSAFGTSLETLITVVSPEFAKRKPISPRALVIAEMLDAIDEGFGDLLVSAAAAYKGKGKA